jgi:hypothetical protein
MVTGCNPEMALCLMPGLETLAHSQRRDVNPGTIRLFTIAGARAGFSTILYWWVMSHPAIYFFSINYDESFEKWV